MKGAMGADSSEYLDVGKRALPELRELLFLVDHMHGLGRVETLANIDYQGTSFPLIALSFGPDDPSAPVFAVFGGVHGLERIGTRVALSYLQTLMELARWDRCIQRMFETTRLVMVPLVNPVTMHESPSNAKTKEEQFAPLGLAVAV